MPLCTPPHNLPTRGTDDETLCSMEAMTVLSYAGRQEEFCAVTQRPGKASLTPYALGGSTRGYADNNRDASRWRGKDMNALRFRITLLKQQRSVTIHEDNNGIVLTRGCQRLHVTTLASKFAHCHQGTASGRCFDRCIGISNVRHRSWVARCLLSNAPVHSICSVPCRRREHFVRCKAIVIASATGCCA